VDERGLICVASGAWGSTGDARPLIALALALRARGFRILFLGDGEFERLAARAGIRESEWFSCCDVPQAFRTRTTAGQRYLLGRRERYRDRWMRHEIWKHRRKRVDGFWRGVERARDGKIVAAVASISAAGMLEGTGVEGHGSFGAECAKIISCPMPYQPSRHFTLDPPDLSCASRLRAWLRQRPWTPDRRRQQSEARRQFCEEIYHLVSASPAVFPRPEDWLPNMQVTGYTPLDDHVGWSPPAELRDFLESGPPPVYVGFGTYPFLYGPRGERLGKAIIEGCRRRGLRCVIQSADLTPSLAAADVLILDGDVDHGWLFPRCVAIVHHGGYGTMHTALVARRPMVIYPFQTDQFLWAARMGELGVGPGFTARLRDLSAARLAADLGVALEGGCHANAARLGAAVLQDDGLKVQVAAIESIIEHHRRGCPPLAWRMPGVA
jgi:UDP:flavonoid glycosyltransferase YjiC (YdhE family)